MLRNNENFKKSQVEHLENIRIEILMSVLNRRLDTAERKYEEIIKN